MIYYSWFSGHGRAVLADELGAEDPFALSPSEIVDRVVAAGHRPAIEAAQDQPFPVVGRLDKIERVGVVFFVSISRDAEEIAVQERRDEAYGPAGRPG